MKKILTRVIAVSVAGIIAFSSLAVSAKKAEPSSYDPWGTSALGPGYPSVVANFTKSIAQDKTFCGEKSFDFQIDIDDRTIPLHITFPSFDGIRVHNENKGYFEPDSYQKITYSTDAAGNLIMDGGTGTKVVFSNGDGKFNLSVYNKNNTKLFTITEKQISFGYTRGELSKVKLEMPLAEKESIYGSGERFNELEQVGKRLLMWNVDSAYHGNSINAEKWRGYKNVPILHSNRGYTLYYNSHYSASVDVGYTNPLKYTLEYQSPQLDFFIWTDTAKENLQNFTKLVGTTMILPKWGYQYSAGGGTNVWRNNTTMYGKATEVVEKYAELGTPNIAAIYVEDINSSDANTYNIFKKTGTRVLRWNAPDLSLENMKQCLPGVATADLPRVKMLKSPTQDSGNFYDFTSPLASKVIQNYLRREISWGLRGGLLDFGELVQAQSLFRGINKTGYEMHNFFPYWYAKSYSEAFKEVIGEEDSVFFSRSASAGSQKYTAFFTGDQQASMEGLRQQLVAGLSASSSGLTTWGGDLAGYSGAPTNTVFARGMQFATFQPVMRSHGTSSRFPWDYGKVSEETYKTHYWLRENLLDKIYSTAIVSHLSGTPITMPLTMQYPNDTSLDGVYETYLFCDDLLVTPVLDEKSYYYSVTFPKGTWYGLWNGDIVKGGSKKNIESPIDKSPVYIKAGSVIPVTVADSLILTDTMQDVKKASALLVTIPDYNRTITHYKSETQTAEYTNTIVDNSTFRVSAKKGNDASAIILKGVAAYEVTVDGKKLSRLQKSPTASGENGFYSEDNGETVINIGNKDWKNIDISLGKIDVVNVMKDASTEENGMDSLFDGDWDSSFAFRTRLNSNPAVISLKEETNLSKILVKWTTLYYATEYKLQVSLNGTDWENIAEVKDGYGGIDSYELGSKAVKYLRIADVKSNSSVPAMVYEIEAYNDAAAVKKVVGDLGTSDDSKEDSSEEDYEDYDYSFDDDYEYEEYAEGPAVVVTEDQIVYIPGTEAEYIKYTTTYVYFPVWAIVLISVGGALAIGGLIFFIIMRKKRKKKIMEIPLDIPLTEEAPPEN